MYSRRSSCPFGPGIGRCSFRRLITIAVPEGLVVDYVETPRSITLVTDRGKTTLDPEEARQYVCHLLLSSHLVNRFSYELEPT